MWDEGPIAPRVPPRAPSPGAFLASLLVAGDGVIGGGEWPVGALTVSAVVFACVFGGALLGLLLRAVLPKHHLSPESKDVVKLGMGVIATMSALVLSLLIASAKSSYDVQSNEIRQISANIILLDRVLADYGSEAGDVRGALRAVLVLALDRLSPERPAGADLAPTTRAESLYGRIHALSPQSEAQRSLRAEALSLSTAIARTRWLLFEQREGTIPMPFLVVLTFWLAMIFASFGLFAPINATVITTLLVSALSIAGATFLILELDRPFDGRIRMSTAPLASALVQMGPAR